MSHLAHEAGDRQRAAAKAHAECLVTGPPHAAWTCGRHGACMHGCGAREHAQCQHGHNGTTTTTTLTTAVCMPTYVRYSAAQAHAASGVMFKMWVARVRVGGYVHVNVMVRGKRQQHKGVHAAALQYKLPCGDPQMAARPHPELAVLRWSPGRRQYPHRHSIYFIKSIRWSILTVLWDCCAPSMQQEGGCRADATP